MLVGDGELMDAIEKKAGELSLRDDILMLGNRNDVNWLYQAMDVFVLPSRYEGQPAVAIEAQLAGLKVITPSRVTTEAKVRDDMAYLDLSAGAEGALLVDPDARACEGDFSRYDIDVQVKALEEYYQRLLSSAGRAGSRGE